MKKLKLNREKILQKYVDGEANIIERLLVNATSKFNRNIQGELLEIQEFNNQLKSYFKMSGIDNTDLWSRIDARIDQEQRAAVFLGERKVILDAEPSSQWWLFPSGLVAGSLAMAIFAVVFSASLTGTTGGPQVSTSSLQVAKQVVAPTAGSTANTETDPAVNLVKNQREQAIKALEDEFYGADLAQQLEVDWMRSAGRLRIVSDGRNQVAAIVIQRPQPAQGLDLPQSRTPQAFSVSSVKR